MSNQNGMMKRLAQIGLLLMTEMSMNANAGWFGFGGTSWKEEVLLHDGQRLIVKRSQSYGGRHEIGQGGAISEQDLTFTLPKTSKTITFKDEYNEDIGGRNFVLLALHVLKGTPYIVAWPVGCFSYDKWGRPNPPYVFFKYDSKEWQRIPLSEFPAEFKTINLVAETKGDEKRIKAQPIVSAELVKELNSERHPPEFKSLLRDAYPRAGGSCGEMIYDGNGGWHGTGLFGKTYEAFLQYCQREKFNPKNYPCETLFKGKK